MNTSAPKTTTAPDEALSSLMGAALDVPAATEQAEVPAGATGGLQDIAKPLTAAARDVLAERQRQISVEGWTPGDDDLHRNGELAEASAAYAQEAAAPCGGLPMGWPWAMHWWKPTTPRRNLVKAGALILAEIERLDRARAAIAAQQGKGGAA